jgi:uncharacterized membrane protein YdjX (TVP38/TMEM64 family)
MTENKGHLWKIIAGLLVATAIGWLIYLNRESFTKESIIAFGQGLPAGVLIAAFLVLPLLGFPLSVFLVLAGLRFGLGWGMVVTTACIFFHHYIGYWIAHGYLKTKILRYAKQKGHTVPKVGEDSPVWFTVLFVSVHGPPYAFKLYLLALTEVPFSIFCYVGAPVYIIFCLLPVGAAAAAVHMDVTWVYIAVAVVSAGAIAWKYWRKRRAAS